MKITIPSDYNKVAKICATFVTRQPYFMDFEQPIHELLRLKNISISRRYLKDRLLSHPNYPSIFSISSTLEELSIKSYVHEIDKVDINELSPPFIIHLDKPSPQFMLVRSISELKKKWPNYFNFWSGVVLGIEDSVANLGEEYLKYISKREDQRLAQNIGVSIIFMLFISMTFQDFSWIRLILCLDSLFGSFISILIIQREFGYDNEATRRLCRTGENIDCDSVIKSARIKLLGRVTLGDLSLVYFIGSDLFLSLSGFSGIISPTLQIFGILSAISAPFTFISLYYQWMILKKWCILCLMVIGILWIQLILSIPELGHLTVGLFKVRDVILTLYLFGLPLFTWVLLIKPLLAGLEEEHKENLSLLQYKRDPDLFLYSLCKQRKVDVGTFEFDLQLGNPDSSLQILIAANPYCGPCAQLHLLMENVMRSFNWQLGLTIRFGGDLDMEGDKKSKVFAHILRLFLEWKANMPSKTPALMRQMIREWYEIMNFEKFVQVYSVENHIDVDGIIKLNQSWFIANNINFTPGVFINGYELQQCYQNEELPGLIRSLMGSSAEPFNHENRGRI